MNKYPDLTYTILSCKELYEEFDYNLVVDWACNMLEYRYETGHLLLLAATTKPTNQFECGLYLEKTIEELGLSFIVGENAIIATSWLYINNICNSLDVRTNLNKLYSLGADDYGGGPVGDFVVLYWAWDDLDYSDFQYYWREDHINNENIEDFVTYKAFMFKEQYEPLIESLLPQ
ncbi:MAG: hypothetical protein R2800_08935 [Flavipsychrobacter sp.]